MCGIFGEFGEVLTPKNLFMDILKLSQERGPDMIGYFKDNNIQFGFNRLSILDITAKGNQPFISPSNRFVIICNGEIINYKILKKKMNISDKTLKSNSDIEIVGHLLDRWGFEKTIKMLRGMFAIAVFDKLQQELYIGRDPAGIKPIYCGKTKKGFIFASQYDQIFKHSWFSKNKIININALSDYLKLGYIPHSMALFQDSYMIGPGEYYLIDKNFNLKTFNYFNFDQTNIYEESSFESVSKFEKILSNLIPEYINADVPVGAFLSGGIDSPLINSIINKSSNCLTAYTISSYHSEVDESLNAKEISKYLNIKHVIKDFNDSNITKWLDKHFHAFSEPFSDFSSLPTFLLSQEASKSFKVMISGDGADELFWGYPRFLSTIKYKNWFNFQPYMRRIAASFLRKTGRYITSGIECEDIGEWVFQRMGPFFAEDVSKIFPKYTFSSQTRKLYNFSDKYSEDEYLLKWLKKNEYFGHMQRRLLKVDRTSMANSLEVRVPFLDQNIIDFSLKIKPELGIKHNEPKILLKKCLKNYLPENIMLKKKQGFSIDLNNLLRNELKEQVEDTIFSKNLYLSEIIDQVEIKEHVKKYYLNVNNNPWEVWTIFALNKFATTHDLL